MPVPIVENKMRERESLRRVRRPDVRVSVSFIRPLSALSLSSLSLSVFRLPCSTPTLCPRTARYSPSICATASPHRIRQFCSSFASRQIDGQSCLLTIQISDRLSDGGSAVSPRALSTQYAVLGVYSVGLYSALVLVPSPRSHVLSHVTFSVEVCGRVNFPCIPPCHPLPPPRQSHLSVAPLLPSVASLLPLFPFCSWRVPDCS